MFLWHYFLMEKRTDLETSNTEMVTISRAEYEAMQARLSGLEEQLRSKTEELAETLLKNQWLLENLKLTKKKLFGEYLIMAYDYQKENNRVVFLGDRTALPAKYQAQMNDIEGKTRGNTGTVLNVAVNYGGRQEIVRGMQILARRVQQGMLRPEDIDIEMVSGVMYTAGQKDPDFILRPSGEHRLSNFMLWQAAYSELVEMDVLWPDFTRADLDAAIEEFNHRSRRFGGL